MWVFKIIRYCTHEQPGRIGHGDPHKAIPTQRTHFVAASNITSATTPGCVAHPQCPTSLSTMSHSTPEPSINACAVSGVKVPSSIALSQILRPSRAFSAQSGGNTGVVMHCSACGMCVFASASCSEGSASLKRCGMTGSKTKRPGAGYIVTTLVLLYGESVEQFVQHTTFALTNGGQAPPIYVSWSTPAGTGAQLMYTMPMTPPFSPRASRSLKTHDGPLVPVCEPPEE